ncbi:type 1 glutamine amidotransferase domain-containing protein [Sphingomonas mesophila]|uniref:type 1 glutamine amidotransferase domain-containing protein n=1 Tax=Sphingomonas mesophila TaxID=2303576 RepID=UPI000E58DC12|nr:type 1 glutamine amidotransferase domain-containing protein [Sphingomonas mesophila]
MSAKGTAGDDCSAGGLKDRHVLIMATDRFEESELFAPRDRLLAAGARVSLASLSLEPILGTVIDMPGRTIAPDLLIGDVRAAEYDALLLPGGVGNPDRLRMEPDAVALVRAFVAAGKPVAAICHGPWLLVEADVLRGRRATSWPSIRTDLRNAGAQVEDRPVVVDGNLITSRAPEDVTPFSDALIAALERA